MGGVSAILYPAITSEEKQLAQIEVPFHLQKFRAVAKMCVGVEEE